MGAKAGRRGEPRGCADGGQGWMGPTSRSSHSWEQRLEKQKVTNTDKKGKWKKRARTARNEAKVGSDENLEVVIGKVEMKIKREEGKWLAQGNFQILGSVSRGITFSDTEKDRCHSVRDLGSASSPQDSCPSTVRPSMPGQSTQPLFVLTCSQAQQNRDRQCSQQTL